VEEFGKFVNETVVDDEADDDDDEDGQVEVVRQLRMMMTSNYLN